MRPEFMPADKFRAYLTRNELNKYARVDGIMAASYVARCEFEGRPIPHQIYQGSKRWRLLDVVARARANGHIIQPAYKAELKLDIDALLAQRAELSAEVASLKHALSLNTVSKNLTGATLLNESEIVAGKMDLPLCSGIYFLIRSDRVVYVGQSVKVYARVLEHLASKEFDGFAFIPCPAKSLDVLESLYIHSLRPELNGKWQNSTGMHAPLRLDALLA
jgi:hypothetical protein